MWYAHSNKEDRFNGAAGITRRKHYKKIKEETNLLDASMGPPELPGGNAGIARWMGHGEEELQWGRRNYPAETRFGLALFPENRQGFNGAAGITRRKRERPEINGA